MAVLGLSNEEREKLQAFSYEELLTFGVVILKCHFLESFQQFLIREISLFPCWTSQALPSKSDSEAQKYLFNHVVVLQKNSPGLAWGSPVDPSFLPIHFHHFPLVNTGLLSLAMGEE
jgi:hypothetical protein